MQCPLCGKRNDDCQCDPALAFMRALDEAVGRAASSSDHKAAVNGIAVTVYERSVK